LTPTKLCEGSKEHLDSLKKSVTTVKV